MSHVLRPVDIPVALYLVLRPRVTYATLAGDLRISASTAHEAVERLTFAGLIRPTSEAVRAVNVAALEEFLLHGIKYAFPAHKERSKRGVPTAHAAPVLQDELDGMVDPVVWPAVHGRVIGAALTPLLPTAAELPERFPALYDLLALVDALRIGTVRDHEVAGPLLAQKLEAVYA